ncbi:HdeD family acid-resistance protein [Hydrogenimonas sp.]
MTIVGHMFDKETLKKYSTQTIIAGILMALLGLVGVFAPSLMSLVVVNFLAWLFLFSAIVQGVITWKSYRNSFSAWLKPAISLITAILLLFFPFEGVAAVGIMLAAYLLVDAYSSLSFGWEYRPNKGWWLMIVNGILSIVLAVIFMIDWPFSSIVLVGLFVGISLFFDGITLIAFGLGAKSVSDDDIAKDKDKEENQQNTKESEQ